MLFYNQKKERHLQDNFSILRSRRKREIAMYKWRPSKTAKREFAEKMEEIEKFCKEHGISASTSKDSYYFVLNGKNYRVSNHSIETSNAHAYDWLGNQVRKKYHENERNKETVYIHASKTRIIDIYNDLADGYELDGRGNRKA